MGNGSAAIRVMMRHSNQDVRSGKCLCGRVRFRVTGPLRGVVYCHCTQCRRQVGHCYAATCADDADLSVEGADAIRWYAASPEAKRAFCTVCGSALFWKQEGSAETSIMAGLFDQPTGLAGESHIFTADKGDYYAIADELPQFLQGRD